MVCNASIADDALVGSGLSAQPIARGKALEICEEIASRLPFATVPDGSSLVEAGVGRVTGDVMGPPEIITTVWVTPSSPTDEVVMTDGFPVVTGAVVVGTGLQT